MKPTLFVLRYATEGELERLMNFYRANAKVASPPPSIGSLNKALQTGRLMVIEPEDGGGYVAASATFDFSPDGFTAHVGELSGTCVTRPLGGCRPLNVQRMFIAARVAVHAVFSSEPEEGGTDTLISIVKRDNEASLRNIEAAGLVPAPALPDWMDYEHHSWTGDGGDGWAYYLATASTVRQAVADLDTLGFFSGRVRLTRDDLVNGGEEAIEIRCALRGMEMAEADLREIAAGRQHVHLGAPLARLVRRSVK
ncbi:hypothetical protein [Methylobacterium oryzae]|uniref:hypothetical protein n=1 Tax=Methylobacterium oryzae TaxID=334852 RepID=UPI002F359D37